MVTIASHEFARYLVKNEWLNAVVIYDPNDEYQTVVDIKNAAKQHLALEFFDLSEEVPTHRCPAHQDILHLISWYEKIQKEATWNDVVVTCTAGISRSAATAFVLECVSKSPKEASKIWNGRLHYPNKLIVRLGAEILQKPEMIKVAEEFWDERIKLRQLKGKPAKVDH